MKKDWKRRSKLKRCVNASDARALLDVVSDFDRQELVNTLDQVRRDVGNRYDLKDSAPKTNWKRRSW